MFLIGRNTGQYPITKDFVSKKAGIWKMAEKVTREGKI